MPITHSFVSAKSDGGDATVVRPGDWNADHVGASDWDATIVKASDQTVTNNSTPQNDSELSFTLSASSVYLIEYHILYSGNNATGDFQWELGYPALSLTRQALGVYYLLNTSDAAASAAVIGASTTKWPSTTFSAGTDASDSIFTFFGRLTLVTNGSGTLQSKFANASAAAGRTSTCRAGSTLRYKKLV